MDENYVARITGSTVNSHQLESEDGVGQTRRPLCTNLQNGGETPNTNTRGQRQRIALGMEQTSKLIRVLCFTYSGQKHRTFPRPKTGPHLIQRWGR